MFVFESAIAIANAIGASVKKVFRTAAAHEITLERPNNGDDVMYDASDNGENGMNSNSNPTR